MKIQRVRRSHYAAARIESGPIMIGTARVGYMTRLGEIIPKVYGGAPAIVFEPHPPIASTRRTLRKPNRGWIKFQAIINGERDHLHGYDDGEAEPQTRGIHV